MTAVAGTAERLPLAGAAGVSPGRTAVSAKHGGEPADSGFATRLEEALNGTGDDVRQGAEQPPESGSAAADSVLPTTGAEPCPVMSLWTPASTAQPQSFPAPAASTTAPPQSSPAAVVAAGDGATLPLSGTAPLHAGPANPGLAAEVPVEPSAVQPGAVRPAAHGTISASAAPSGQAPAVPAQAGATVPATTAGATVPATTARTSVPATTFGTSEAPGAMPGGTTSASLAAATAGVPAAGGTARAGGQGQPPHGGGGQKVPDGSAATGSTRAFPGQAGPVVAGAAAVEGSGSGGSANGSVAVSATVVPGVGAIPVAAIPIPVLRGTTAVESSGPAVLPNGPEGTQGILPAAPQLATPVPAAGPVAPAVAPQTAHPPLTEQLARPIFQLATGQAGTKVMTVQLAPDSLGPVTVRAHLGVDGVRIELLAATDAGRDGLRLILSDLKRDLAAQGLTSSLEMSSSSGGGAAGQQQAFRGNGAAPPGTPPWKLGLAAEPAAPAATATRLPTTSLDITV